MRRIESWMEKYALVLVAQINQLNQLSKDTNGLWSPSKFFSTSCIKFESNTDRLSNEHSGSISQVVTSGSTTNPQLEMLFLNG